jgi:hypothetical protein
MIYENVLNPSSRLSRTSYTKSKGFRIKVLLIAGENGEFSQQHYFDLKVQEGGSFIFEYLSPQRRQQRRRRIEALIGKGNLLLLKAGQNAWTDQLSREFSAWDNDLQATLIDMFGRIYYKKFLDTRVSQSLTDQVNREITKLEEVIAEDSEDTWEA